MRLAYLGNSFIYYNDLPATLQALHPNRIDGSSVALRGGASLTSLAAKGARHPLEGHDQFESVETLFADERKVDYVIFNDFSQGPARAESRDSTITALEHTYAPLLATAEATPVLMATWAYRDPVKGSDDLGDAATFTASLYAGTLMYKAALDASLQLKAIVAPVGDAFLLVHDERPSLWARLFDDDGFHPSKKGTDLAALVLTAALWGSLSDSASDERMDDWDDEMMFLWDVALRAVSKYN
ncbi:hypothetical protein M885DRAFT_507113 [Pelagophyceae sp. CCMP2097]|nr:hypothetical protein M885DRAFT_507113 [Pelagophyceae sp. CCMP2097]|mmetsp:Transcript_34/g.125  ORF Transcript_34/g.125 Transcript_34/m.125 type:complete len:242 (+) Transcript_34:46-771(+)